MNYRIISIIAAVLCWDIAVAQADDSFRKWEGEIFGGGNVTLGESSFLRHYETAKDSKSLIGYTLGVEFRRNLEDIPLDIGLRLSFSKTGHDVLWKANENSSAHWERQYNNAFVLAAVGDWTFNREAKTSPFAGVGVGLALNEYLSKPTHIKPFVMPRVGIDFRHRVRLSVCANLSEESQNTLMLTVGYLFGLKPASGNAADKESIAISKDVRRLMRQSNAFMWSGVGTLCIGLPTLGFGLALIGSSDVAAGVVLGGIISGAGGLISLASVPLFIVSHKKKSDALRLSLQMSAMTQPGISGAPSSAPCPGLTLEF